MNIVVLFADGFEEIEGLSIIDILRRASISTEITGVTDGEITGAHGLKIIPDNTINQIDMERIDAVILPGGAPGYFNLANNQHVIHLIKKMNEKSKMIGAICASPYVLAKAGILRGKKATIYPGMENEIMKARGIFQDDIIVIDGNIITRRGLATSIPFALAIVEMFTDKERKNIVQNELLADYVLREEFL
ncbi:MAG: DJ-1 family glyoxalase III [Promethearchaeota archaeon]|jgi:4-methyl-5(b-hydroxyethyl)-thiazole monophosphate biosynthesis